MIFKIRIGSWRFTFTIAPVTDIIGVNSQLPNGKHIVMWDFDDFPLEVVQSCLMVVQDQYELPNIYIFNTGKPNHHIAYCFCAVEWQTAIEIVAATPNVDPYFFKYGVYREHWTLRVSPKEGRKPKLVQTLYSDVPETAQISELNSWVKDVRQHNRLFSNSLGCAVTSLSPFIPVCDLIREASAQNMRRLQTLRP